MSLHKLILLHHMVFHLKKKNMWEKGTCGELFDTTFLAQAIPAPVPQNKLVPLQALVPVAQKQMVASAIFARCMWKMQHRPPVEPFHVWCITSTGYCYSCKPSSTHTLKLKETFLYALSRLSNTYVDDGFFFPDCASITLRHAHISRY